MSSPLASRPLRRFACTEASRLSVYQPASEKYTGHSPGTGELTGSMDGDQRLGGAGWPNNLDLTAVTTKMGTTGTSRAAAISLSAKPSISLIQRRFCRWALAVLALCRLAG